MNDRQEEGRETRSNPYRRVRGLYIHVQVAEAALGHALPAGAVIHHVDGNRNNNAPANLVICPSQKYHKLLHVRTDALNASGNADFRKCRYCKTHDAKEALFAYQNTDGTSVYYHSKCHSEANKAAYRKRMEFATAQGTAI